MIPLMKNTFVQEYETRQALAAFIIQAPRLSMGETCFEFERRFAAMQGAADSVLFNSGASANLAILQALKNLGRLQARDKVAFSALTWSTNVMPIIQMGMKPVPVDCTIPTLNAMVSDLTRAFEREPFRAFFLTNVLGFAGDLDLIQQFCTEHNILLLEDNCEALGTILPTGRTGSFGTAASFSFFVAHHMSTIEGGCACTDDQELAEMLRIVRANGWDRNLNSTQQANWRQRHSIKTEFEAKYTFYDLAFNFRPTEITGFLGLQQLDHLEWNCARRLENYCVLEKIVANNDELVLLDRSHLTRLSSFAFPVVCRSPKLRDKYISQCAGAGVELRPMIAGNMVRQPFFRKYVRTRYHLPNADTIHLCGFYFGNYPELSSEELETLSSCLKKK